jgi:hypothetical protein
VHCDCPIHAIDSGPRPGRGPPGPIAFLSESSLTDGETTNPQLGPMNRSFIIRSMFLLTATAGSSMTILWLCPSCWTEESPPFRIRPSSKVYLRPTLLFKKIRGSEKCERHEQVFHMHKLRGGCPEQPVIHLLREFTDVLIVPGIRNALLTSLAVFWFTVLGDNVALMRMCVYYFLLVISSSAMIQFDT